MPVDKIIKHLRETKAKVVQLQRGGDISDIKQIKITLS